MGLFDTSGQRGIRRVIDVSGDGANNRGRVADAARDEAVDAGIVINGLPILSLEPDLDEYYRAHVIGGPGAFVITLLAPVGAQLVQRKYRPALRRGAPRDEPLDSQRGRAASADPGCRVADRCRTGPAPRASGRRWRPST